MIRTQTLQEQIPASQARPPRGESLDDTSAAFVRGAAVVGLEVLRAIASDQVVSVVGVGGLGSIVAEHLIHMGFHKINLIDPDVVELSNLNRLVGATHESALHGAPKVAVVADHLLRINHARRFGRFNVALKSPRPRRLLRFQIG
ncbi:MAG: ThiF family adenylyltransferase [Myxococcales bacterium]|nr:ThiF family adenylyltransferase [Myxococcales bacterium]